MVYDFWIYVFWVNHLLVHAWISCIIIVTPVWFIQFACWKLFYTLCIITFGRCLFLWPAFFISSSLTVNFLQSRLSFLSNTYNWDPIVLAYHGKYYFSRQFMLISVFLLLSIETLLWHYIDDFCISSLSP